MAQHMYRGYRIQTYITGEGSFADVWVKHRVVHTEGPHRTMTDAKELAEEWLDHVIGETKSDLRHGWMLR